jgi:hypothetical protein
VLVAALPAAADVIHLKNGRTIWADQVREVKDHVEYDLGEDTYAIPKSSVDHIDGGGLAPVHGWRGSLGWRPRHQPASPFVQPRGADVALKVIRDGKVDADALASLRTIFESRNRRHGVFSGRQARVRSWQLYPGQTLLRIGAALRAR